MAYRMLRSGGGGVGVAIQENPVIEDRPPPPLDGMGRGGGPGGGRGRGMGGGFIGGDGQRKDGGLGPGRPPPAFGVPPPGFDGQPPDMPNGSTGNGPGDDKGLALSSGQWQRVALSRAFLRADEADLVVFE